jgi:hypothetical protein
MIFLQVSMEGTNIRSFISPSSISSPMKINSSTRFSSKFRRQIFGSIYAPFALESSLQKH